MADQSDVEAALVAAVAGAVYPSGADQASCVGAVCRVYRGWPNAAALDADLAAGRAHVTVFPTEAARNTTRWEPRWASAAAAPTLTVTVAGLVASFAGSAAAGQLAGVLVDGRSYVYRTGVGDTPELVAEALALQVNADEAAVARGASVSVPGATSLVARTVADTPVLLELRRQEQQFRLTAWCPTPALRDAIGGVIDTALSAGGFLALADGTTGRHRWVRSVTVDDGQVANLFRRDLIWSVDYPTTLAAMQPAMLFGDLGVNGTRRTV